MTTTIFDSKSAMKSFSWWQDCAYLQRFISDLVSDELARLRFKNVIAIQRPWPLDTRIDKDLGADSLELLMLATALNEALHMHESGMEDTLLARRSFKDWIDTAQNALDHYCEKLTFRTSGSSGIPKPCSHDFGNLWQEVEELAGMFAGRKRVLSAVPSHHIYGFLFTILLPQALGIPAGNVIDIRASSPAGLARDLQAGDLIIGHPEFWHALGRTVPQLPSDIHGITSTSPIPDPVCNALEQAGLEKLFQIYGSTETGGIGWRNAIGEPYQLFTYLSFTEQALTLSRCMLSGINTSVPLQDALHPLSQRTFRIGTRHDSAVQVGGINVFPQRVQKLMEQHPEVSQAMVRLMRPDEGSRLKVFIVPQSHVSDMDALKLELQQWFETVLTIHEIPKAITFGSQLPKSASGKLSDWIIE